MELQGTNYLVKNPQWCWVSDVPFSLAMIKWWIKFMVAFDWVMLMAFGLRMCGSEINKTVPGPWNDPPTREEVEEVMKVGLNQRWPSIVFFIYHSGLYNEILHLFQYQ